MTKKVYAFDFDGTLTTKDTLLAFIRYAKGTGKTILGALLFSPILILMRLHLYPNWKAKQQVFSYFFKGMEIGDFNDLCKRFAHDNRQLLIVGENNVAVLDLATDKIIGTRRLPFRVVSSGRYDYKPILFDNRGGMHLVNSINDMTNEKTGVDGQVSAFASSKHEHLMAFGMFDGTIWLKDRHGKKQKLVGHLSQVSKMKFNGTRLYSSSYDGKLLYWATGDPQIKPITLFQSNSWLTDFVFSSDKNYFLTGEKNGTVTEYLISLPKIAQRLRLNVKRNFTKEEWNYYVGKGIPYRDIKK